MSIFSKTYKLERVQRVSAPRSKVFAFFSDAFNLERLTPPFLNFRILTPRPIDIQTDTIIEYRIKLFGIPMYWRTRILRFEPQTVFIDSQERGPYVLWHHTHTFEDHGDETLMTDTVLYRLPLGPLGWVAHALFVRRTLERIFNYRHDVLADVMGEVA